MNPLNQQFSTAYNTAPFSKINNNDFLPAFKTAINKAKLEIDNIVNNDALPNFENTIEALDFSGQELDRISSIFFNLNSAETNDEIQKIAQDVSPLLSEFSNDIALNEGLFNRVKAVYGLKDSLNLICLLKVRRKMISSSEVKTTLPLLLIITIFMICFLVNLLLNFLNSLKFWRLQIKLLNHY